MKELSPSVFTSHPFGSVLKKSEAESIARNIMVIRARLGRWDLTWPQYRAEREKDGGFSELEKAYFEEAVRLIPDAIGAIAFSPSWASAARKAMEESNA